MTFLDPGTPIWRFWEWHWASFLGPALVLAVMVAPALGGGWDNDRFWDFNRAAWLSVAFAWLAAMILAVGLQATAYALEALLEIDLGYRFLEDIWTLSFGLLWPWLALAGLPARDRGGRCRAAALAALPGAVAAGASGHHLSRRALRLHRQKS